MQPIYERDGIALYNCRCEDLLDYLIDQGISCLSACVTDPPYGLSFMNKKWDYDVPRRELWERVVKVLRPGSHLLSACGTRTQHRMAVNIEDGGFEIRDVVAWLYGQGFPKSMDVSKAIDREASAVREVIGKIKNPCKNVNATVALGGSFQVSPDITAPATPEAKYWNGWGTALKPAMELWTLARKPIGEATVAKNVLRYGTGALNIEACRITTDEDTRRNATGGDNGLCRTNTFKIHDRRVEDNEKSTGRWPANVTHDGSDEVLDGFPESAGQLAKVGPLNKNERAVYSEYGPRETFEPRNDKGSAARFFYCAKASSSERNAGLVDRDKQITDDGRNTPIDNPFLRGKTLRKNNHPTVKPLALMEWLVKMITPIGGVLIDPFAGSGTTLLAAKKLGYRAIGVEVDPDYCQIIIGRLDGMK